MEFAYTDETGCEKHYRKIGPDLWLARAVFQGMDSGWTDLDATDAEVVAVYEATQSEPAPCVSAGAA